MQKSYMKAVYTALIGIVALTVVLFFEATSFTGPKDITVQLFFTSDLYGYLKPCG
ncbi:MAG: hypothetical protein ACE5NG_05440 [bacterium]